jgi:hypothetical protein
MADIRFDATHEFVGEWTRIKTGVHAPLRTSVEFKRVARFLPFVFIVEQSRSQWTFRLAGTALYDLYCGELTGKPLSRMWGGGFGRLPEAMAEASCQVRPVLVHSLAIAQDEVASVETVLLPLRTRADFADADRFIGLQTFAPGETWWAGGRSISDMRSVTVSMVGDADALAEERRRGREVPAMVAGMRRPALGVMAGVRR